MVTQTHRGVKTTIEIPEKIWTAARQRALDERSDLRSIVIVALQKHLGLKVESPKKGAKNVR
jgi:hypothetical protein